MENETIYIDSDYKCHAEPADGRRAVQADFFAGREHLIPLYRFVPDGEAWTREDGVTFSGEMVCPI